MNDMDFLPFVNPATGEQFGRITVASEEDVQAAMQAVRNAFPAWCNKPLQERIRILRKFQAMIIDSLDEITTVINQDCGKSRQDALIEVYITLDLLNYYLKEAPNLLRRRRISTGVYIFKHAYVEPRPFGVVVVISPWNYPFALSLPAVLTALLAGNTVLLKPSEVTAATGVLLESLFQRIPELAPFVRVLHGGGSVGKALVEARPDFIFLTGSTETGRKVMRAASEYLIPVKTELGGKDPMIVLEDADIEAAAQWGVWGANFNAGQTCMSVERAYVVAEVYDEFLRQAVARTLELRMGFSAEKDNPYHLGPITDPRQVKIIRRHLEDALEKGARLLTGGRQDGNYFEPAILVDVNHDMLVMQEETFGPLLPVMKVKDAEEALRLANDNRFGLGASVWSADLERAQQIAHQVQSGSVIINDTIAQFAVVRAPFGGVKESGYGRTHGQEGLLQFTQPFSYVTGDPPFTWDIPTIARQPGRYELLEAIMKLSLGVTPVQRLEPVLDLVETTVEKIRKRVQAPDFRSLATGAAVLGGIGALAGFVWARRLQR